MTVGRCAGIRNWPALRYIEFTRLTNHKYQSEAKSEAVFEDILGYFCCLKQQVLKRNCRDSLAQPHIECPEMIRRMSI